MDWVYETESCCQKGVAVYADVCQCSITIEYLVADGVRSVTFAGVTHVQQLLTISAPLHFRTRCMRGVAPFIDCVLPSVGDTVKRMVTPVPIA